jgi:peroxiredoxin
MKKEHEITFDILVDEDNTFAEQLGIAFNVQDFIIPHYQQLGIDLRTYNGNNENSLPIPAVFVVDKDYNVTYSFIDVNYMNRVNINELIMSL